MLSPHSSKSWRPSANTPEPFPVQPPDIHPTEVLPCQKGHNAVCGKSP